MAIRQLIGSSRWQRLTSQGGFRILNENQEPFSLKTFLGSSLRRVFLPAGHPASVHPNYLPFTAWNLLQSASGSIVSVLSTQCLLYGLGLSSHHQTVTMAAGLNWILKDGLGQLGGIAMVTAMGRRFDWHPKGFRFLAAVILKVACLLEMLVPLLPGHFLLLGGLANVAKNVCWMATSATRAQIHRHLSRQDNLGDLAAKAASQSTAASLLGTGLGALLSHAMFTTQASSIDPVSVVVSCLLVYAPLTCLSLYASYRSCTHALSPRLTRQRLEIILRASLPRRNLSAAAWEKLLTPEEVAKREHWLWPPKPLIQIEPRLREYPRQLRPWGPHAYRTETALFFTPAATPHDQLRAFLAVWLESEQVEVEAFVEALRRAGWSTDEEVHLTDTRRPIFIESAAKDEP